MNTDVSIAEFMSISPKQCRAARALTGLSRRKLAWLSEVSERTIVDFERHARSPQRRTLASLRNALEDEGVIFIDQDYGGGPGVRLKESL
jgi:DNA-binding transcriptional regulator YiaG